MVSRGERGRKERASHAVVLLGGRAGHGGLIKRQRKTFLKNTNELSDRVGQRRACQIVVIIVIVLLFFLL
jgi:hypothetical protein